MRKKSTFTLCVLACLLLQVAGCGDPTQGTVSGTVVIDGQPAKTGGITYEPLDKDGRTAGAEILDGQYSGIVPVGKYRVKLRVSKKVGETKIYDTPDSPIQPILEEVLPEKFNDITELTIEVPAGKSTKDWKFSGGELSPTE